MATPELLQNLPGPLNLSETGLTDAERAKLSKVLFPETHTNKITVLGKDRELRPLSIKYSRKLNSLLDPLTKRVEKAQKEEQDIVIDEDILKALMSTAECLCEFYGESWNDIYKAVKEEEIPQVDLEAIAYTQQDLNGVNDFLLQPLRAIIHMLKFREIATAKMESMLSSSIMLPS